MYLPVEPLASGFTDFGLSAFLYIHILRKGAWEAGKLKIRDVLDGVSHLNKQKLVTGEVVTYYLLVMCIVGKLLTYILYVEDTYEYMMYTPLLFAILLFWGFSFKPGCRLCWIHSLSQQHSSLAVSRVLGLPENLTQKFWVSESSGIPSPVKQQLPHCLKASSVGLWRVECIQVIQLL